MQPKSSHYVEEAHREETRVSFGGLGVCEWLYCVAYVRGVGGCHFQLGGVVVFVGCYIGSRIEVGSP